MALTKYKLGELIEGSDLRNDDGIYGESDVVGVSTGKTMIETKANLDGVNLKNYKLFPPGYFAYVADTSRRGDKIALAYNETNQTYIVSTWYVVFQVSEAGRKVLSPDYLFMYFNRPEFDRYARRNSWGAAREYFWLSDMGDIELDLPPLAVQEKAVAVYRAMGANLRSYEQGLADLKLTCDAYIEELRREMPCKKIGPYIEECFERNDNNKITLFQGVNVDHVFTEPKRVAEDSENGSVVRTGQFAFNKVMKSHGTKLPIALRIGADCVVSNSYQVFKVSRLDKLVPEYLMMWLNRDETQRYCGFISFGTTRDIFTFEDMKEIAIPIPSVEIQQDIVNIQKAYLHRKEIAEKLKAQMRELCPILIKGSLEEGEGRG